jgi:hypothetical protein
VGEDKQEIDISKIDINHVREVLEGAAYQALNYAAASVETPEMETQTVSGLRADMKERLCELIDAHGWPILEVNVDRYLWALLGDGNGNPVTAEKIENYRSKMDLTVTKTELVGWYERLKTRERRESFYSGGIEGAVGPNQQL